MMKQTILMWLNTALRGRAACNLCQLHDYAVITVLGAEVISAQYQVC